MTLFEHDAQHRRNDNAGWMITIGHEENLILILFLKLKVNLIFFKMWFKFDIKT